MPDYLARTDEVSEIHHDWEQLVAMSYTSGELGRKGVYNLDQKLFPQDDFPHKYDSFGNFLL